MKKIVRLTERDLTRLVNRVIREFDDSMQGRPDTGEMDIFAKSPDSGVNKFRDRFDAEVEDTEFEDTKEFGPEEYDDFMEYINGCDTKWCLTTKKYYDLYANRGPITVGRKSRG